MSFTDWLSLFTIALLGAASPGPSLAVVIKNTLGGNKINGICTAWAHAAGIGIYALLTIFGLAIILKRNPILFKFIAYFGAAYLLYLGYLSLISKGGIAEKLNSKKNTSYLQSAKEGIIISALNPKIGLFFLALFSQFMQDGLNALEQTITVLTPVITDGLWYTMIALLLSKPKFLNPLKKKAVLIDRITGVVLILIGMKILFS